MSKYFFNNRVVDKWNALNEATVQAETIASFKKKYDNEVKARKLGSVMGTVIVPNDSTNERLQEMSQDVNSIFH